MYLKYPEVVEITSLGYFLMSRKLKEEFIVQIETIDEKIILKEKMCIRDRCTAFSNGGWKGTLFPPG